MTGELNQMKTSDYTGRYDEANAANHTLLTPRCRLVHNVRLFYVRTSYIKYSFKEKCFLRQ